MKILNTLDFISEKMKIMPISNNELDNIRFNIVDVGDDLSDGDIVVVGYEDMDKDMSERYIQPVKIGIYDILRDRIMYDNASIRYGLLKNTFTWIYNNHIKHNILLIYRSRDGKSTIDLNKSNDEKLKHLNNNSLFKQVYKNHTIAKHFGL